MGTKIRKKEKGLNLIEYLSESTPPRFVQRQVFCYNPFYNAILQLLNLNFKMNTKFKAAQNRILNVKKDEI